MTELTGWDPEMLAALARAEELLEPVADRAALSIAELRMVIEQERRWWNEGAPAMASVVDLALPREGRRQMPVRLYYPHEAAGPLPAIVYAHGGGWVFCNLATHDRIMRTLARDAGAVVVGVDYALAPDYKFPTAHDDMMAALDAVAANAAAWRIDAGRIALAGDRAGGNLALAPALAAKDRVAGVLAFYAVADTDTGRPSYARHGKPPNWLLAEQMPWFFDAYARSPDDLADPRLSLVNGALAGLPPVWLGLAAFDVLIDENLDLAARLKAAGVTTQCVTYAGVCHNFIQFARVLGKAGQAIGDAAGFFRRHVAGETVAAS
ncbi:MAG: alpha/beta hydrolase fold domain-containing protein [Azospirillaceae bacterium]